MNEEKLIKDIQTVTVSFIMIGLILGAVLILESGNFNIITHSPKVLGSLSMDYLLKMIIVASALGVLLIIIFEIGCQIGSPQTRKLIRKYLN